MKAVPSWYLLKEQKKVDQEDSMLLKKDMGARGVKMRDGLENVGMG